MQLEPITVCREILDGKGPVSEFTLGNALDRLDALCESMAGTVKLIYLDPPYMTGEHFYMRVRVGQEEWSSGKGSLHLPSYDDPRDREIYLETMRKVLTASHKLLSDDGMLFLHIDYRSHPYLRLLADEIFSEKNFLNEIIWVYQSGGRSINHFSRKHDVILFYRKSENYDFSMQDIMVTPSEPKANHMRRHVDPDGRVYRSIRSGGRVYTYYDDDPVAPSDVWTDLSHLQQRDPERTGFDTQKPLTLLNRIVRCASREGELVMDLFCGSGTALEAAAQNGRRSFGIDQCPLVLSILRRRLESTGYRFSFPPFEGTPICKASLQPAIGFYHVTLEEYRLEDGLCEAEISGLDAVDGWSVGYLREDGYHSYTQFMRSRQHPALKSTLEVPMYEGDLIMAVHDILGRSFYYRIVE